MIRTFYTVVATLGSVAIGVSAQAAVTIDSATVFTRASAVIITDHYDNQENQNQAVLGPGDQSVETSVATSNTDANGNSAAANEDVLASFTSPQNGMVIFSGSSTSLVVDGSSIAEAFNAGSSFNYDFTLTSNYRLTIDYALAETDNFYPDNYYQVINLAGGPPLLSDSPADGSYFAPTLGEASVVLTPGHYELGIVTTLGDISGVEGFGFSDGFHTDQYAFGIGSVPEPTTWAMLIGGMAMTGGIMRRRKRILVPLLRNL